MRAEGEDDHPDAPKGEFLDETMAGSSSVGAHHRTLEELGSLPVLGFP